MSTRTVAVVLGLASCSSPATLDGSDATTSDTVVESIDAAVPIPASGTFRQTCDGSAGVALDATHFLNLDDEEQGARIYQRSTDGGPIQTLDLDTALDVAAGGEVDLEDAARRGDRMYAISSHGRNKDGKLKPDRSRFAAFDLTGAIPAEQLTRVGRAYNGLLVDMLDANNWDTPDAEVIAALVASSRLDLQTDASLVPEAAGTNIEGLATLPAGLAIGFRNPQPNGKALVVTLTNPDPVVGGATAHFGTAVLLDLGGLAIRGLGWSESHGKMLVLAGPHDSSAEFRLYTWSGGATDPAVFVTNLPSASGSPEAVIPYAGSHDVQVLFDQGTATIGSTSCKDANAADQVFTDVFVRVD